MKPLGPSYSKLLVLVSIVLAAVAIVALNPFKHSPLTAFVAASEPDSQQVYVIFEGPWAIVPDPDDTTKVIAIAPKTASHRPLGVAPANIQLDAGLYELRVPVPGAASASFDKGIFRTDVDPKAVQQALGNRLKRYAVRLPRPEAYIAETRYVSRVGSISYPPDASTEMDYVSAISFRYAVPTLAGFQLTGKQDVGAASLPKLLQLDTPTVRFEINPADADPRDSCHTHARQAFRDVTHLLGLTLYIDFTDSPSDCHKKDPQLAHSANVLLPGLPVVGALEPSAARPSPMQEASIEGGMLANYVDFAAGKVAHRIMPLFFFFHTDGGACIVTTIVANGS